MPKYDNEGVFSVIMVVNLRDGNTAAGTVQVDPVRLNDDTYQDDLYDRVADMFGGLVKAREECADKTGEADAQG